MDLRPIVASLLEARLPVDLDRVMRRLRQNERWTEDGLPRDKIIAEIDQRFAHHAEHYYKLLNGGVRPDGMPFKGSGSLEWVNLAVEDKTALLTVKGSYEYENEREIYEQRVKFMNFRLIAKQDELTWNERARLLLRDNLKVHCECPAYRYFYSHAAWRKGFGLVRESDPARERNPKQRGGICKHLNVTLRWLGGNYSKIASEMRQHYSA